jgi:hypothetical protein
VIQYYVCAVHGAVCMYVYGHVFSYKFQLADIQF